MSLHAYEALGEKACICGWAGDATAAPHTHHSARLYVAHVEAALGTDAYLDLAVACPQCGSRHRQPVVVGLPINYQRCAVCGTAGMRPDNAVWRDLNRVADPSDDS